MSTAEAIQSVEIPEASHELERPWVEIVVPVYNEAGTLAASIERLHAYLVEHVSLFGADHDRRQRQHGCDLERGPRPRRPAPLGARREARRQGSGSRAQRGVVVERRARPHLHGCRPLDRPLGAAAARRPAALGSQRPRDRDEALTRGTRRARPEARADLACLQHDPPSRPAHALLRCAVRLQGDPRATARSSSCRSSATAPGSSTPSCSCSPSEQACASTRCRSTGPTIPTRASTSSRRRSPTSAASSGSLATSGPGRVALSRVSCPGCEARRLRRAGCCASPRSGSLSTLAYAGAVPRAPSGVRIGQVANAAALLVTAVGNTAANRRFTFAIRERVGRVRHQLQGLAGVRPGTRTDGRRPRARLGRADRPASRSAELAVLIGANLLATVLRFVLLRAWVFRATPRRTRRGTSMSATAGDTPSETRPAGGSTRSRAVEPCARPRRRCRRGCARRCSRCCVATACLYLSTWPASGYANSFYSAAVQAGSKSWKAMLFGSFDSSNFITVDKPPAALWVMDISARRLRRQLPGASSSRRRSKAWPRSGCSTRPSAAASRRPRA